MAAVTRRYREACEPTIIDPWPCVSEDFGPLVITISLGTGNVYSVLTEGVLADFRLMLAAYWVWWQLNANGWPTAMEDARSTIAG